MTDTHSRDALASARVITDDCARADALLALMPHLDIETRAEAVVLARNAIRGDRNKLAAEGRARRLGILAIWCAEPTRREVLVEAVAALRQITDDEGAALIVKELASLLPEELVEKVFAIVHRISNEWSRAESIAGLAPRLPVQLLPKALGAAGSIGDEPPRAVALEALAPRLSGSLLTNAMAMIPTSEPYRSDVLVALAPHLDEPEREHAVGRAVDALRTLDERRGFVNRVPRLAPFLPADLKHQLVAEALEVSRQFDAWDQMYSLLELLPHLGEPARSETLDRVLAAARAIPEIETRVTELARLAARFDEPTRAEILAETVAMLEGIEDQATRESATGSLMSYLLSLENVVLHRMWSQMIHGFAARARSEVLADLRTFGSLIGALGGPAALGETAQAILDTGTWWN